MLSFVENRCFQSVIGISIFPALHNGYYIALEKTAAAYHQNDRRFAYVSLHSFTTLIV
jgi:hypothetical protein